MDRTSANRNLELIIKKMGILDLGVFCNLFEVSELSWLFFVESLFSFDKECMCSYRNARNLAEIMVPRLSAQLAQSQFVAVV